MKKTIAILLALCLCVGLCACAENEGSSSKSKSKDSSNGFSSKEAFVDAYLTMFYVKVVSEKEFRKIFPKQYWEYMGGESYFENAYDSYVKSAENSINRNIERFGEDCKMNWKIVNVEDTTNYCDYTEEERQECLDRFGVEPDEHFMYCLTVSITGVGSKDEYTNPSEQVYARKIAGRWYMY